MGSRRQRSVNYFGPNLRKPFIKKAPGKLMKKCLVQLKRTQQSFRRGDDNVAKRPQQNKVATKRTLQFPIDEPSHAKASSRPNVLSHSSWPNKSMASPWKDVEKSKPSFSRALQKNTQKASPSRAMPNSGVDSLPKRPNNGMGSSAKNVESYSWLNNVEAPRSKNTKMPGSSYSRPNDEVAPQSMNARPFFSGTNCGSAPLARNMEKSKMVYNSRKQDNPMVMETSNSNLALKGKKVMGDILPNLGSNYVSLPDKNLSSHQTVDASPNLCISKDGRTDVYKSKIKRMEPLFEDDERTSLGEAERTVDDKFIKRKRTKNCSRTNRRSRYVVSDDEDDDDGDQNLSGAKSGAARLKTQKDCHQEVSNLYGSQPSKPHHYCSLPIDEPIWSGIIKIGNGKFVSLAAHLSTKYCDKVWKLSRSLGPVVEVTKLSRLGAWPKSFEVSRPTDDNIALYLLPTEMRQEADFDQLVKEVMENDMVLRAIVGEDEMLIFPSILLPEQHQTFQGKPYLWAVFKRRILEEERHDKGRCAHEKGKQQASHFSVGEGLNMEAGLEASEELEVQGMEQEQNPKLARPNVPSPTTKAPTMSAATMSANHCQDHSNMAAPAAPTGTLFGFVVQRTPRLEQLIQEMQREGAVMVAMQGQMIGPGIGLGRQ